MSSARKKPVSPKREYKSQRLELRLAPSAKKVIQQAMSVTGLAADDLAYEGARRLLDEHQRMVLSGADRDEALRILKRAGAGNPPMKGDELRAKRGRRCPVIDARYAISARMANDGSP